MGKRAWIAAGLALALGAGAQATDLSVTLPAGQTTSPIDGRLILVVSPKADPEPMKQVALEAPLRSPYLFGQNVVGLRPGQTVRFGPGSYGWPVAWDALPPGDYSVQVVLNPYETFRRAAGPPVSLPPDRGEGQHWNAKPGNLYSVPVRVHLGPETKPFTLPLTRVVPPVIRPADTGYVQHVRIQSALLTRWWGRPMFLGAYVLLPWGWGTHPHARFPLLLNHGHFPADGISAWRETPPDPDLKPDYSERFHLAGYNRIEQQESYANFVRWRDPTFPRFLLVEVEHANPYYDDSYAVNSANLGPYGDAINKELIPYIEKRFRGIGQGWARFTMGGSTGGWEAMATQLFYPDMYNGAFVACPDPVDFRAYTTVNLYDDKDAYAKPGLVASVERPAYRNYLGETLGTMRDVNHMELALGDHGRSGEQFDIWQAVFGPMGADGYPQPIWNKETGAIDPGVAAYWRDHFDLSHIVERDWKTLAPKLYGKLHLYVGSADTYFLTDAVYFAQDRLEKLSPGWGGTVDYGDRAEHCWNGDHGLANAYSRLHYSWMYLPQIMDRINKTAPKGADLSSWRY
jgi:hypothetical protein